jgi:hypothetical protein
LYPGPLTSLSCSMSPSLFLFSFFSLSLTMSVFEQVVLCLEMRRVSSTDHTWHKRQTSRKEGEEKKVQLGERARKRKRKREKQWRVNASFICCGWRQGKMGHERVRERETMEEGQVKGYEPHCAIWLLTYVRGRKSEMHNESHQSARPMLTNCTSSSLSFSSAMSDVSVLIITSFILHRFIHIGSSIWVKFIRSLVPAAVIFLLCLYHWFCSICE